MRRIIYWLWEHHHRVFLLNTMLPIKNIAHAHKCCRDNSPLKEADYKVVFKEGDFYSYPINPEGWYELKLYLFERFGRPVEATQEITYMENKAKPQMLSSNTIQFIAMVGLVLTLACLVLKNC